MKDINDVPTDEYIGPTFSINMHDREGDSYDDGIFLHHGHTSIKVAKNLRGFKAYVRDLQLMVDEIAEALTL